jgi:hypothetical protein
MWDKFYVVGFCRTVHNAQKRIIRSWAYYSCSFTVFVKRTRWKMAAEFWTVPSIYGARASWRASVTCSTLARAVGAVHVTCECRVYIKHDIRNWYIKGWDVDIAGQVIRGQATGAIVLRTRLLEMQNRPIYDVAKVQENAGDKSTVSMQRIISEGSVQLLSLLLFYCLRSCRPL